ncbi:MAG: leucine-rich repeat protein [Spirochaetaceae bacterium]|nr:leucine-rich repeat protein [Spirochaetaceae bacterium]
MKKIYRVALLIVLSCIVFTSCDRNKSAIKKLFNETHEKELVKTIQELESASKKLKKVYNYENYEITGRSEEWNATIQPLVDKITEFHNSYHGETAMPRSGDEWEQWAYYFDSDDKGERKNYCTSCPFCAYEIENGLAGTFEHTALYERLFAEKIVKEELNEFDEDSFKEALKKWKTAIETSNIIDFEENSMEYRFSKQFYDNLNALKTLHFTKHKFDDEHFKEFMYLYEKERDYVIDTDKELKVFDSRFTCCPLCRIISDYIATGELVCFTENFPLYLEGLSFYDEWHVGEKFDTALNNRQNELAALEEKRRAAAEKETAKYIKAQASTYYPGKLRVYYHHEGNLDIIAIPSSIEGIDVVEVHILNDVAKEVFVPNTVKSVSISGENIESVHLNDGLICISGIHSPKIKKIHIPDSVQYMKDLTFQHCCMLEEINLPKSLKRLGNWAFSLDVDYLDVMEIKKRKDIPLNIIIPDSLKNVRIGYNILGRYTRDLLSLKTQTRLKEIGKEEEMGISFSDLKDLL